jgi:hypothetical protein
MRKILEFLTNRDVRNLIWRDMDDILNFVLPILICFLFFWFCKIKNFVVFVKDEARRIGGQE